MIYHPRKADANQGEIVDAMRAVGWKVIPTHTIGQGFPDLVADLKGWTVLIEVKDPTQPKHRHELTQPQKDFHAAWSGPIFIVFTVDDALAITQKAYRQIHKV